MGRSALSAEANKKYNVYYARHRNLWLDLKILLRTVWVVLT